ncbi:hypothetical protein ACJMK2_022079 [Sinanodonta woodiana]|uniref:TIR domain-containing protein n=1 Tax=Sinanodonta woodiana TaxID=1069815 RepID=A0ABD3THZ8_SINWO
MYNRVEWYIFSACLIYDTKSREIVTRFVTKMNEINPYLIFFDPNYDILPGSYENDALAQIIEERCYGKVLVFLPETDNFTDENMNFALQYAKHLDAAGKKRGLVPVRGHKDTFWPKVVKGLKEINMCENDSLHFWVQQSRQFRPSFSPKGPLRKECIMYNRSYSYPLTSEQSIQIRPDGQCKESHSSRPTTYPYLGEPVSMVDERYFLQIDNDKQSVKDASIQTCLKEINSCSISFQNGTSFGSSQHAFDESNLSTYSSSAGGNENEIVVSDTEVKEIETTNNAETNQPNKEKMWTKMKKLFLS